MKKVLVIHPNDPSTKFLNILYKDIPADEMMLVDETFSNSQIRNMLQDTETYESVLLLGHGTEYGLCAPQGKEQFGRLIISAQHVQFLRNFKCIGIWCNANIFADKYELHGLFSGMVISELVEAEYWHVPVVGGKTEIYEHIQKWCSDLHESLQTVKIEEVPDRMYNLYDKKKMTLLEQFNYESVFYFD